MTTPATHGRTTPAIRGRFGGIIGGLPIDDETPATVVEVSKQIDMHDGSPYTVLLHKLGYVVPLQDAPIYLKDKTMIGRVDELVGVSRHPCCFSIALENNAGPFAKGQKFYINKRNLMAVDKYLESQRGLPPRGEDVEGHVVEGLEGQRR